MTGLTQDRRDAIPAIVLSSNAAGDARSKLLRVMKELLDTPGLGFYAFPQGLDPAETWAEATYGTKLYYRDIVGQPDYPLLVAQHPTQKLLADPLCRPL